MIKERYLLFKRSRKIFIKQVTHAGFLTKPGSCLFLKSIQCVGHLVASAMEIFYWTKKNIVIGKVFYFLNKCIITQHILTGIIFQEALFCMNRLSKTTSPSSFLFCA